MKVSATSFAIILMLPGRVFGQDWQELKGPAISLALSARVVAYENGGSQNFFSDGRTLYENGGESWGKWRVEGDKYCSQWPPNAHWACYSVQLDGLNLTFKAAYGALTIGKYIDLQ